MKLFGKEIKFNNNKIYHEGDKPKANDIVFTDGETFQQKLDNGSLRGQTGLTGTKGETGERGPQGPAGAKGDTGAQGPIGATGPQGPSGARGTDGFTWKPSVDSAGNLTWTKDSSSITPSQVNIKGPKGDTGAQGVQGPKGDTGNAGPQGAAGPTGPQGPKGADGLTTSVTVNGQKYSHSGGNITLPNFLKETGGTVSGTIDSTLDTGTYADGNKGKAIINSKNKAGGYTTIVKSNSNNGVFAFSSYYDNMLISYTSNETVSSGVNKIDKRLILLDESGNSFFPGTIKAEKILGPNTIKLSRDSIYLGYTGVTQTCDNLRLGDTLIAADNAKNLHFLTIEGLPCGIYSNTLYAKDKWIKIGGRWLTIDSSAPSGVKGDIWIQSF